MRGHDRCVTPWNGGDEIPQCFHDVQTRGLPTIRILPGPHRANARCPGPVTLWWLPQLSPSRSPPLVVAAADTPVALLGSRRAGTGAGARDAALRCHRPEAGRDAIPHSGPRGWVGQFAMARPAGTDHPRGSALASGVDWSASDSPVHQAGGAAPSEAAALGRGGGQPWPRSPCYGSAAVLAAEAVSPGRSRGRRPRPAIDGRSRGRRRVGAAAAAAAAAWCRPWLVGRCRPGRSRSGARSGDNHQSNRYDLLDRDQPHSSPRSRSGSGAQGPHG